MNKKLLAKTFSFVLYGFLFANFLQAENPGSSLLEIVYQESFTDIEEGELPEDLFVLDGSFEVIKKDGNKCLKLSGKPVGEHGFLYGPRLSTDSFEVSFSCLGAVKSRKHSVFAGSLGGIRGLIFRSNPVSKKLFFAISDAIEGEASVPAWSSRDWIKVVLHVRPTEHNLKCTILVSGENAIRQPFQKSEILIKDREKIRSGRCALWGFSYAEKAMYWDNLKIRVSH